MEITHVMRGEEWISSTPKHLLLYKYFDWQPPIFVHLSLMLSKDGGKLSKRKGDVAVESFLEKGYLPEALINFIGLTILSVKDGEKEILSLDELIKMFDWEKVHRNPAILDTDKLDWINGQYIRKIETKILLKFSEPYLKEKKFIDNKFPKDKLEKIVKIEQQRINKLSEIGDNTKFFFIEPKYDPEQLRWKDMSIERVSESISNTSSILCDINMLDFKTEKLNQILYIEAKKFGQPGETYWPLRMALSGQITSPPPSEISEILGKEETIKRLKRAEELLKKKYQIIK